MAITKRFTNWAVSVSCIAQAATPVYLDGIIDLSLNGNLRTRVEGGDGLIYKTHGALVGGAPVASMSLTQLKTFLDICGVEGMLIDKDADDPGVVLYFQKYKTGGTRELDATAEHHSTTIENGIMVPRTLACSHGEAAVLSADIAAIKAGAIDPITFLETATIPAAAYPAAAVEHTVGKVDLNGTSLDGIKNINVDFGINLLSEGFGDSDIYPEHVSIDEIDPTITLVTEHIDLTSLLTEGGAYYAAETLAIYLRKRDEGGTFVADNVAEHIKLTLGKCRIEWTGISGKPKEMAVMIKPWYTAGASPVSPIAINTASAIT
jgi:hypothetical protein